jgi:hypothetical protein
MESLTNFPSLVVKQSTSGWCFECCCWETKNSYSIYSGENRSQKVIIYIFYNK